jgi:hypothetical protein
MKHLTLTLASVGFLTLACAPATAYHPAPHRATELERLAHQMERSSAQLLRQAERELVPRRAVQRGAHRGYRGVDPRVERSLGQLHTLHRDAAQLRRRVERDPRGVSRNTRRDVVLLVRSFDQAELALSRHRVSRHVLRDLQRTERALDAMVHHMGGYRKLGLHGPTARPAPGIPAQRTRPPRP